MVSDVSKKTIGLLALAVVLVSLLGTFVVLTSLQEVELAWPEPSPGTGQVSIAVGSEKPVGESSAGVYLNVEDVEDDLNA